MAMPAAPSSASRIAVACPIPEAAPVTAKYLLFIPDIVIYGDIESNHCVFIELCTRHTMVWCKLSKTKMGNSRSVQGPIRYGAHIVCEDPPKFSRGGVVTPQTITDTAFAYTKNPPVSVASVLADTR
jgi:hypothetical protein